MNLKSLKLNAIETIINSIDTYDTAKDAIFDIIEGTCGRCGHQMVGYDFFDWRSSSKGYVFWNNLSRTNKPAEYEFKHKKTALSLIEILLRKKNYLIPFEKYNVIKYILNQARKE